jgi:hypothetical protein
MLRPGNVRLIGAGTDDLSPAAGIPRQVATAAWPPQLKPARSAEPQDIVGSADVLSAEPPLARHHFPDVDPPCRL